MILSRKFVSDYIDIDKTTKELAEDLVKVGNEYDAVSSLVHATKLVIGEVISCENHPKSDHLHICKVDIKSEVLDIICGAPNVRKGLKVIVALDGCVLDGGTIKKSTILDCTSNGMLCSLSELGIEKKYLSEEEINGIHELPNDAVVGEDPIKYLELDDEIIDFELTSNRSDLLSMIGFAYEIGATNGNKVKLPEIKYNESDIKNNIKLEVNTDNCYTFLVKRVNDVSIKESPLFIKNRLMACGIRPINNVVDISNYIMMETGQPLHFYDADKLGNFIGCRMAKEGESLKTLDEIDRVLTSKDIVIINDKNESIGLAGVMGGYSTEIDENTKNIIIESAIFNPYNIRYTSIKTVRSEASIRFEKGLDVNRTYFALDRACTLLSEYAYGKVSNELVEYNTLSKEDKNIEITIDKINNVLGLKLTKEDIENVFNKLGFTSEYNNGLFNVYVPSRRIDVNIKEDLIEEVGRIYGVDNIVGTLPVFETMEPVYDNRYRIIRDKLISLGLNEVITYSLVNDKTVNTFTNDTFNTIKVLEPMSEDRTTLRYNLIQSLIDTYKYNKSHNIKDLSIFEIGVGFYKEEDYKERNLLSGLLTGEFDTHITSSNIDFYYVKGIIEELLDYLGYKNRYSFISSDELKDMHPYKTVNIIVNGVKVGFFGRLHPKNIKEEVYVFEIELDKLLSIKTGKTKYKPFSKYPSINKDLSFVMDKDIDAGEVLNTIKKCGGKYLSNVKIFDYYVDKDQKDLKSIGYSLSFESTDKTLDIEEINPFIDNIIETITKKYKCNLKDK